MNEPNAAPKTMTPTEVAQAIMAGTPDGRAAAAEAITELLRLYGVVGEAPTAAVEPLIESK